MYRRHDNTTTRPMSTRRDREGSGGDGRGMAAPLRLYNAWGHCIGRWLALQLRPERIHCRGGEMQCQRPDAHRRDIHIYIRMSAR